jgi:hypothetical protein
MKNFKKLEAFDADGDLTKRWYISYHYLNPKTGKFQRFREYSNLNRIHNLKQRRTALYALLQARQKLLDRGVSPFDEINEDTILENVGAKLRTLGECIDKALEHKKLHQSDLSYKSYKSRINHFKKYLTDNRLINLNPTEIGRRHIIDYLDIRTYQENISGKTRNNLLIDIRSLFSCMMEFDYITTNPASLIKKVSELSEKNEFYKKDALLSVDKWLAKNNPYLHIYCKFIYYSFLRPCELVRLQVKDIDLHEMVINVPANKSKTGKAQTVKIMDVLKPEIEKMKLDSYPPDFFIFTSKKRPHSKPSSREYFTKKFKSLKDELKLSKNHTMYGLKHTGISTLLMNGASESDIRKYSRHSSTAFANYTRHYEMQAPPDLSKFYLQPKMT